MSAGDPAAGDAEVVRSPSEMEQLRAGEPLTLPVIEETARIEKRMVETGRIRVQTHTETIEELLRETLRTDAIGVTRVPINRIIADGEPAPVARTENGVTILPVLEEVLVVEKRLVLKEEVHIHQTTSAEVTEVPVTLRKQRAVIERVSPEEHDTEIPSEEKTP